MSMRLSVGLMNANERVSVSMSASENACERE